MSLASGYRCCSHTGRELKHLKVQKNKRLCAQGLQIRWILPLKWDTRPYFLPVLELKHVCARKRYDMLISDSRTIGVGSKEEKAKMSSKLSSGDMEGETLRPTEDLPQCFLPHPQEGMQPRPEERKEA